ncbi:MAG: hypothetical protein Roseis2KO_53780 [Roseivirga sp.]
MRKEMKKWILAFGVLLVVILATGCGSASGNEKETQEEQPVVVEDHSTIQKLGESIFWAIRKNDAAQLGKYNMTLDDLSWTKTNMGETDQSYEQSYIPNILSKPQNTVAAIRRQFAERGLTDWSTTTFDRLVYKSDTKNGVAIARRAKIHFTNGTRAGVIDFPYAYESPRGWLLSREPDYYTYK